MARGKGDFAMRLPSSAFYSAVVAGGANVIQEIGPESMSDAASRTADEIAALLREAFKKRGWIGK